jgi:TetR/AcrR family transcriptional regulator, transcriptional repressor for nem operon
MRYSADHKAEVRQRIVQDAALRVSGEGLNGAAVAAVMRDTGLTHGGFYKHFTSKDDLLVESVREAFRDFAEKLVHAAEQSRSGEPWKAIVQFYLSVKHCDDPSHGCPTTALGSELARVEAGMRGQFFADILNYKNTMVPFMPGRRAVDKESTFFAIFSTMIGAMQLARALPHRAAQEKVLTSARSF